MWHWTQGHLATMLRTHPCRIPDDWPLFPASVSGPLRDTGLYCGSWPILSIIECNTPLRRRYRTSQTSWNGPAGRHTPCYSAADGSVITSQSWRRPPAALSMCTGGNEENPPPHYPKWELAHTMSCPLSQLSDSNVCRDVQHLSLNNRSHRLVH
jgi:hypothetical protein